MATNFKKGQILIEAIFGFWLLIVCVLIAIQIIEQTNQFMGKHENAGPWRNYDHRKASASQDAKNIEP